MSLRFLDVAIAAGASVVLAVVCALAQTLPSPFIKQGEVTQFSPGFGAVCNSNGTTGSGNDDTAALQAAINYAQTNGVRFHFAGMPSGFVCRTTAPLQITSGIEMVGDGANSSQNWSATPAQGLIGAGSWLYADHTGHAINMDGSDIGIPNSDAQAHISNFGIIRNQTPYIASGSWTPVANDFDIEISYVDARIDNLMLWNGTNGIQINQPSSNGSGRLTIDGLRGEPYQVGIEVDQTYDVARIANVHFWPYSDQGGSNPVNNYRLANGIGLKIKRSDGLDLSNYFSILENQCIGFYQNSVSFGTSVREQWNNVYCDANYNGIYIDSGISRAGQISVQASNVVLFGNSVPATGAMGTNGYNDNMTSGGYAQFDFSNIEVSNYQQSLFYAPSGVNDHLYISGLRTVTRNLSGGSYPGFNYYGTAHLTAAPYDTSVATTPMFPTGEGNFYVNGVQEPYASLVLNGSNSDLVLVNPTNSTNQKIFDMVDASNALNFRLCNDAYSSCNSWMAVTRTGYVTNVIQLGDSSWTTQLDLNSTGLFPDTAGGLTLGTAADPWGTTYTANVQTSGYAIASLPTCNSGSKGMQTFVTNGQTTPTYLGTVSTTGSVIAPVFCNGSNWVYH
jgi:hypothetical protein